MGRLVLWWAGVLGLFIALVSPLDRLGEQLATAHMVQHLLIADLVPIASRSRSPSGSCARSPATCTGSSGRPGRSAHPVFGVIAYVGAMWFWHIPAMYDAALSTRAIHTLEHLSFAAAGLLYWWHLLSPIRSRMRLGGIGPVLYMGSTKILVGFLGDPAHLQPRAPVQVLRLGRHALGRRPLADQHIAGLTMALEQSLVMGVALAYLFIRMISESEAEDQRAERYGAA